MTNNKCQWMICLFLVIATLAVFWQVRHFSFINFDDPDYITRNPHVQAGLTVKSMIWAFTATHAGNWHPITWLSHMADIELYGLNPGGHHLTSLILHIINTVLLFLVFNRMTHNLWQSSFVAALFAIHPLHVESVCQIAERKDVLSTFFWFLTLRIYVSYAEHPRLYTYIRVFFCFMLGLMAKPMLVTLPCVLILLDYWPLRRFTILDFSRSQAGVWKRETCGVLKTPQVFSLLIREKIPLFILAAISSIITFFVQKSGGAVRTLEIYPFPVRLANAAVSYVNYIEKTILPYGLQFYYPHPYTIPAWQTAGACVFLIFVFWLTIRQARQHPYLIVGWLWYLGTLVPVIGLVQVGSQAMADRYTYVPLIGIFIMIAWGIPSFSSFSLGTRRELRYKKAGLIVATVLTLTALTTAAWLQVRHWRNSFTLFAHAVQVNPNNFVAHNNMGVILAEQGRTDEAIQHYSKALRTEPNYALAHNNLANALVKKGKTDEAIRHYSEALRLQPDHVLAHNNLGAALFQKGDTDGAIAHFQEALRIKPGYTEAYENLQKVLAIQNERFNSAIEEVQKNIRQHPNDAELYHKLGNLYKSKQDADNAIVWYEKALTVQPECVPCLNSLAICFAVKGEYEKAVSLFEKITEIQPDNPDAYYALACVRARQNKIEASVNWLKKAVEKGFDNWQLLKTDNNLENIRNTSYYLSLVISH